MTGVHQRMLPGGDPASPTTWAATRTAAPRPPARTVGQQHQLGARHRAHGRRSYALDFRGHGRSDRTPAGTASTTTSTTPTACCT